MHCTIHGMCIGSDMIDRVIHKLHPAAAEDAVALQWEAIMMSILAVPVRTTVAPALSNNHEHHFEDGSGSDIPYFINSEHRGKSIAPHGCHTNLQRATQI